MTVSWERIDRKLAIIQALLADLAEDLATLRTQQAREPVVAEKKVGRKLRRGESVEVG